MISKYEIRQKMKVRRRQLSLDEVSRKSKALCRRLMVFPEVTAAPMLAIYMACDNEIEVYNIYKKCKQEAKGVLLPRFNTEAADYEIVEVKDLGTDTSTGFYGIREPLSTFPPLSTAKHNSKDVTWLIPALAFDMQGHRLGRGGGYYDRLLAESSGFKIGVGYDWQILNYIPASATDVDMDLIVTDSRSIDCRMAA